MALQHCFFSWSGTVMFLYVVTASSGKAHQNDSAGGSAVVGAAGVVDGSLWARVVAAYEATAPPAGGIWHSHDPQWRGPNIWGKTLLLGGIHSFLTDLSIFTSSFVMS